MPGTEDTGVVCNRTFRRANDGEPSEVLICDLSAGHSGPHGLSTDEPWPHDHVRTVEEMPSQSHPVGVLQGPKHDTFHEQRAIFIRAEQIFKDRTLENGELWKTVDPIDTAHHIRHKAHRIYFATRRLEIDEGIVEKNKARIIESALDTINYCAFIIRQIEEEE